MPTSPISNKPLTADRLRRLVRYDKVTGIMTRRVVTCGKVKKGDVCGTPNTRGYLQCRIDGRLYLISRLAILYVTGEWPTHKVDHRNHVIKDNRWDNIRDVTQSVNMQNQVKPSRANKTGFLGVSIAGDRFAATIRVGGRHIKLGRFDQPTQASEAYLRAKRAMHPGNTL